MKDASGRIYGAYRVQNTRQRERERAGRRMNTKKDGRYSAKSENKRRNRLLVIRRMEGAKGG